MRCLLHGGFRGLTPKQQAAAWQMFLQSVMLTADTDAVLVLPWARSPKVWRHIESAFAKHLFSFTGSTPEIVLAESPKQAAELLPQFSTIYMPGGTDIDGIVEGFKSIPNLHELAEGKTFFGISAGAYALSAAYYHKQSHSIREGSGLAPVGVVCHYNEAREAGYKLLQQKTKYPAHALVDGLFIET